MENHDNAALVRVAKDTPLTVAEAHCSYGPLECDECAAEQPDGIEMSCTDYEQLTNEASMNVTNRGFLSTTANQIDNLLHLEEHEQISTEKMLYQFAELRDRIRTHVQAQR